MSNNATTDEKKMQDAINAIVALRWKQLLILNQHLSEHITNIWLDQERKQLTKDERNPW